MGDSATPGLVWVTGGNGFAGGYLCRELERRGVPVLAIDRNCAGGACVDLDLAAVRVDVLLLAGQHHRRQQELDVFLGIAEGLLAVEQAYDEMASKLGIDPLEFRLLNALQPGDATPGHATFMYEFTVLPPPPAQPAPWR